MCTFSIGAAYICYAYICVSIEFKFLTKKLKSIFENMIGGNSKMIKEKYTQLLLSHLIRGIITIGDTHKLYAMQKKDKNYKLMLW
jgi:hypothetical protein